MGNAALYALVGSVMVLFALPRAAPAQADVSITNSPGSIIAPSGGNNLVINGSSPPIIVPNGDMTVEKLGNGHFMWRRIFVVRNQYASNLGVIAHADDIVSINVVAASKSNIRIGRLKDGTGMVMCFDNVPPDTYPVTVETISDKAPKIAVYLNECGR